MTESPQQPGYSAAQQQQAAAYTTQQQQAYAAQQQAYAQPSANIFDKLPMNMLTFGLAGGGLVLMLIGNLLSATKGMGERDPETGEMLNGGNVYFALSDNILNVSIAILVIAAVAVTTGSRFRNVYRAVTLGLTVLAVSSTIGSFIDNGTLEGADGAVVIAQVLIIIALALFCAATFTMTDQDPAALAAQRHHAAMLAAQQQQQQAAQQQAAQQQAAQQQYGATQPQQQHQEQQTAWQQQQQPPAQ